MLTLLLLCNRMLTFYACFAYELEHCVAKWLVELDDWCAFVSQHKSKSLVNSGENKFALPDHYLMSHHLFLVISGTTHFACMA